MSHMTKKSFSPNMVYKSGAYIFDIVGLQSSEWYRELTSDDDFIKDKDKPLFILILSHILLKGMQSQSSLEIMFNIFHELHHYIQDLTIQACIARSEFNDYLQSQISVASHVDGLKYPLFSIKNRTHNQYRLDSIALTKNLFLFYEIYESLYKKSYEIPSEFNFYSYNSSNEDERERLPISLTYQDLIEAHAYWKTLLNILHSVNTDKHNLLVHNYLKDTNYIPFMYNEKYVYCEHKILLAKRKYITAFFIYMVALGSCKEIVDYFNRGDFKSFKKSQFDIYLLNFISLLEISLCTPSPLQIINSIKSGKRIEDFSFVHRFYRFIQKIKNKGLPACIEDEYYFNTLAKYLTSDEIFSYEEADYDIGSHVNNRAKTHYEIVAWSQYRAMNCKKSYPNYFCHINPISFLQDLEIPLFICLNGKIDIIICSQKVLTNCVDDKNPLSVYNEFFIKRDIRKYLDQSKGFDLCIFQHNAKGMLREIINRQFSHSILESLSTGEYFSCPLNASLCPYYKNGETDFYCKELYRMDSVKKFCKNNVIRYPGYKGIVDDESGNTPDCMYINYMYDNNIKFYNIQFE